ncbi:hypothetical protein [Membranihabitans marinus]|uniref:hypothetical protein n=1 Tax=Membranihabitans marinus TaxID=1227546 RepID=UPI001F43DFED|nr:hypothetical protein [Membranihabitans marinus]
MRLQSRLGTVASVPSSRLTHPEHSGSGSFIQSTFTGLGCPPDNFIQSSFGQLHSDIQNLHSNKAMIFN